MSSGSIKFIEPINIIIVIASADEEKELFYISTDIPSLKSNGSELPKFEMNPERDYLSVIIPIHKYFISKIKSSDKVFAYQSKIKDILSIQPLSLSELATAMGYKGITAKLSRTVNEMLLSGKLEKVTVTGYGVKLSAKKIF